MNEPVDPAQHAVSLPVEMSMTLEDERVAAASTPSADTVLDVPQPDWPRAAGLLDSEPVAVASPSIDRLASAPDASVAALRPQARTPTPAPTPQAAQTNPALQTSTWLDYHLATHYQPIYSLTHQRVVGHEALLRATRASNGESVPPLELFAGCADDAALVSLDRAALAQHVLSYGSGVAEQWLFLNVHPRSFASATWPSTIDIAAALERRGLRPEQVVIEVLESSLPNDPAFDLRLEEIRGLGCLVSLDDFGAGHSNFDRVFRLRPEIVKLDRSVAVRAETDAHARRIIAQMVSLLHECGSLVLMEGIETAEGAYTALRCDVDFVQGYHFGRPDLQLAPAGAGLPELQAAWDRFDLLSAADDQAWQVQTAQHRQAIELASVLLAGGATMDDACSRFLAQPGADMCYLLDKRGRQVVREAYRPGLSRDVLGSVPQFAPLRDAVDSRWSRRPYFQLAARSPNIAQVTRPYMTLQGSRMCFTVSIQFDRAGETLILCGDATR